MDDDLIDVPEPDTEERAQRAEMTPIAITASSEPRRVQFNFFSACDAKTLDAIGQAIVAEGERLGLFFDFGHVSDVISIDDIPRGTSFYQRVTGDLRR